MTTHKEWLDKEYQDWGGALKASSVDNFKEHPMVIRMLSLALDEPLFKTLVTLTPDQEKAILALDNMGRTKPLTQLSHYMLRMIYYAKMVLELKPKSICELGAGVGDHYAVLRILGYEHEYWIEDLPEVNEFRNRYLEKVSKRLKITTELVYRDRFSKPYDLITAFYSLGEMDDRTKRYYVEEWIPYCRSGLVLWNSHSGASDKIEWKCKVEDEFPLTLSRNKKLSW